MLGALLSRCVAERSHEALLQRSFYARGVKQPIEDPWYILTYLLSKRAKLGIRTTERDLAKSFRSTAKSAHPTKFADWLKRQAPRLNAEQVLRAAWDFAGGTTEPPRRPRPVEEPSRKRSRDDVEFLDSEPEHETAPDSTRERKKRRVDSGAGTSADDNEFADDEWSEEDEDPDYEDPPAPLVWGEKYAESSGADESSEGDSAEVAPRRAVTGKRRRAHARSRHAIRLASDSESSDDAAGSAGDYERPNDEFPLVIITWNLEKTGQTTLAIKQKAIVDIVDRYHPSIMVMQEVTDAGILFEGVYTGGQDPVPYGLGLNHTNLVAAAEQISLRKISKGKTAKVPHYPLGNEYDMLEGPTFRAGTYRENYPLLFDTTKVEGTPVACFIERTNDGGYRLVELAAGHEQLFGKKEQIRRQPLVWKFRLKTSTYSLRADPRQSERAIAWEADETPADWAERTRQHRLTGLRYRDTYVMVVHTSPSMSIKEEVDEIMKKADWLRSQQGDGGEVPLVLAGDWYMEKADKNRFASYVGATEGWRIEAARVGPHDVIQDKKWRKKYGDEKSTFLQTNYPGKGEGQTADHFVVNELSRVRLTEMVSADSEHGFLERRPRDQGIDERREGKAWRSKGADHAPIAIYLTVEQARNPST